MITPEQIPNLLLPETDVERTILAMPEIVAGLMWGEPRYGHPEGKVVYHVKEIFSNIDNIEPPLNATEREQLRIITLLHDTFKYREDKSTPRDWTKHHSALARRFAQTFITDSAILDVIENHDEAYYCWRLHALMQNQQLSDERLAFLLGRVGYCLSLYFTFFMCDTATGDKTQAPVKWFKKVVPHLPDRFIHHPQNQFKNINF